MLTSSTSMLSLVGALLSAGAYGADGADAATPPLPLQAAADIRRARVQLYCGHDAQAMADIRSARGLLDRSGEAPVAHARAALDKAAWLARRGHFQDAEAALDEALARLETERTQT